jgi:uncharacterized protein (TIGR04255 family)
MIRKIPLLISGLVSFRSGIPIAYEAKVDRYPKVLRNKPLVEALLEIKWRVPTPASTPTVDPNYRMFVGRFYDRVVDRYPVSEPLEAAAIPDGIAAHIAQYRFRAKENGYPLLQIGPGLLTINDTESYTWDRFEQEANWALSRLLDTFRGELSFDSLTLRYINGIQVDFAREDVLSFLERYLKVRVAFPRELFSTGQIESRPAGFVMQASFQSRYPQGSVQVKFAKGTVKEQESLIWETVVSSTGRDLPELPGRFAEWLGAAHSIAEDWFFKLIEGELLRRFE